MSSLPLRFVRAADRVTLVCEGTERPQPGQRVRASGSQGNGFLVLEVLDREALPQSTDTNPDAFGLRLRSSEVPWSPNTPLEVVRRSAG